MATPLPFIIETQCFVRAGLNSAHGSAVVSFKSAVFFVSACQYEIRDFTLVEDGEDRKDVPVFAVYVVRADNGETNDVAPCHQSADNMEWLVEQAWDAGLFDELLDEGPRAAAAGG